MMVETTKGAATRPANVESSLSGVVRRGGA